MQLAAAGAPPGEVPGAEASCISRRSVESKYFICSFSGWRVLPAVAEKFQPVSVVCVCVCVCS